jgi:hypothetical protein
VPIIQFEHTALLKGDYEVHSYNISFVDCLHGEDGTCVTSTYKPSCLSIKKAGLFVCDTLSVGQEGPQAVYAPGDDFHCKP